MARPVFTQPDIALQYGALPYRLSEDGRLEYLLITSRRTKRWIIPKGWPIKGLAPSWSAAREAFEEAGLVGKPSRRPLGSFEYVKQLKGTSRSVVCEVVVYPLRVLGQRDTWPEISQRDLCWMEAGEAAERISENGLQNIMQAAIARLSAPPLKSSRQNAAWRTA